MAQLKVAHRKTIVLFLFYFILFVKFIGSVSTQEKYILGQSVNFVHFSIIILLVQVTANLA
jgi:hypothetical protein